MKKYKILSMILVLMLLFNNCIVLADTIDKKYENIKKTGDTLGYSEGRNKASQIKDINSIISSYDARPKYEDIAKKYPSYFKNQDKNYEVYFLAGYYEGFDRGYYEILSKKFGIDINKEQMNYADAFGLLYGELYASRDYHNNIASNWAKVLPTDTKIIELFGLSMETSVYRIKFLRTFKDKFKEGYQLGYEKSLMEPKKISLETGTKDGEEIGSYLGMIYGTKDFYENKTSDYKRNLPTDSSIKTNYSLNRDSSQYEESFLGGFKKAYEESYNKAFREANINDKFLKDSDGYENGFDVGSLKGEVLATQDYIMKKQNNWKNNGITNTEIIRENLLALYSSNYRQSFISGFWAGFSETYTNTYKSLNQEESINKSVVKEVPISGTQVLSGDSGLSVEIDKGSYYNNIVLSIDTLSETSYTLEDKYIRASNYYKIDIKNPSKDYDNSIPITLAFEYYGKSNGGLYKLINNKWVYISSQIEDGKIIAKISPRNLVSSGIYVVLVDKDLPLLTDARGHWGKEEINTYVRRGFISGYSDNTFRPDRNISRVEFLIILSKVYDWKLPEDTNNIKFFIDYEKFKSRDKIISYAYEKGYISGYEDKSFRPDDFISYKEVEIIMRRVLNNEKFYWSDTASRMLYNKKVRCRSFDSKDNKITRAEFIYMLYLINEWRF